MTGLLWINESGLLTTPIALTNTHSVGIVRDALIAYDVEHGSRLESSWSLPVVAETYDGALSDINGMHVTREHVYAALVSAHGGPIAEGSVGGGTGMVCHGFKGGIGTSSRIVPHPAGGWTVGVLVQANHGARHRLTIDSVPVGRHIGLDRYPRPALAMPPGAGSIIVVVATDAPLLPMQCRRLAQRATIGIARTGGCGANSSGDIFLAFATGNAHLADPPYADGTRSVRTLDNDQMTPLFESVSDATEESIINALCAATTMTGANGHVAHGLPLDTVERLLQRYRSLQSLSDYAG
ncbi:MAG: P1 family peptidase [Herpetosiphon sp.]